MWLPGLALSALALSAGAGGVCFAQAPAQETKPGAPASSAASPDAEKANPPQAAPASNPADPEQAQLLADSEKLVKLSQELKTEVGKSTKDTLSVTVIKKAEEVEALAKSLRERMNKVR
jgi:hypothetical protein